MKIILLIGLCMCFVLLSGCDNSKLCQYQDNCVSGGTAVMPCCKDVWLIKPSTHNYNFIESYNLTNMCCYPSNCPQSKDNPEHCICQYMVHCYEE